MLEHWHPQLIREEAALVFSTDREVALRTRVARIHALTNIFLFVPNDQYCFSLEDELALLLN